MITYRAEVDGLRTVAVIPVLLFHLGYGFVKGGFYGVDVFFVISGYLITKILTEDIENGNFSMVRFWVRRVKRLMPLLLTVILVVLCLSPLLFKPVVKNIGLELFPVLFSYYNFYALFNFGDYWGESAEQAFFLQTWSLSVENNFICCIHFSSFSRTSFSKILEYHY
jgi:peptidoglycan/LPS O-acetylase OafA/YrhL